MECKPTVTPELDVLASAIRTQDACFKDLISDLERSSIDAQLAAERISQIESALRRVPAAA